MHSMSKVHANELTCFSSNTIKMLQFLGATPSFPLDCTGKLQQPPVESSMHLSCKSCKICKAQLQVFNHLAISITKTNIP